ncbi:sensor domain-containing protein [Methylotenera mobilis]|uniref:Diguanylate cyclase with PAS/PAC and GAF sensors n=1 Tax=Methylotenera mobilis (strain JLW8 / ATCC BAA-1282 / DSM 17540) TaxID=583345 RepID=C6WVQ4_METML|nr:diguanylate cyclase [Methylotenera mobilis]ACT48003.1 diguanylate cyclase with PAS/PAC and GAF sensors [Methylotenera mobilis JLW8]
MTRLFSLPKSAMTDENQEQRLRKILFNSLDAFVGVDHNGLVTEWNQQAANIFGWSYDEAIGHNLDEMIIPERFRDAHRQGMLRALESGHAELLSRRIQLEAKRKTGEEFPVEMAVTYILNAGSYEFYAFIQDISNRKVEEQKLRSLASNDTLTGIRNRSYFNANLPEAMARSKRSDKNLALMYLDIDHFKSINDSLGHEAGDSLLKEFATRLKATLREADIVSRLGGDEFTVIIEGIATLDDVSKVATNIINELNRGNWLDTPNFKITSSIGIAIYDGRVIDADKLVALADKAMYKAKHSGRNNFKILRFDDIEVTVEGKSHLKSLESFINTQHLLSIQKEAGSNFLQSTLATLRRHLDMDVAFISHIHDGVREFMFVDSKDLNPPIAVGDSGSLDDSYCQRVIDGRLPEIINDAFELPEAMSMDVTTLVPVRAHMSVPIRLSNGKLYGTFCCFSYTSDQTLNERDISIMHVFADLIAQHL